MKKLMTFLVLLSLMTIPAGCQKTGDSDTSETGSGDGNAAASNGEGFGGGAKASDGCCSGSLASCCSGCGSVDGDSCCSTPTADGCCATATPGCCTPTNPGCCAATTPGCCAATTPGCCAATTPGCCAAMTCDGCAAGACAGCGDPAAAGACCGAGPDGAGGGGTPQFEKGTAEDAIVQVVLSISKGEQAGLAEYISSRAKGTLAELRGGKLNKESLDKLKQQMGRVKILNNRTSGTTKTITLQNMEGETFRFTCRKEDGKYLIRELEIREASGKQKRGRRK